VLLGNGARLAMTPIEPLFSMGTIYVFLLALNSNRPQLLLWCGVLLGFGLLNEHSTVFFIGALVAGLALSPQRQILGTKWVWFAAAMALLIALPNVIWQVAQHFPTLEDQRNAKRTHKNVPLPPLPFLKAQIMMLNLQHARLARGVRVASLASRCRFLGFTYLVLLAVMM
jgi:4-amino-4-deoxy-L-arabinose transferase-like glycosyltransferase